MAYWLETKGYLSDLLYRNYQEVIKSQATREKLLETMKHQYPFLEYLIKNLNTSMSDFHLDKVLPRLKQEFTPLEETRMFHQYAKAQILNSHIDKIIQSYALQITNRDKLKFKRVINGIIREFSNEAIQGNDVMIQEGLRRIEKETLSVIKFEIKDIHSKYLEQVNPKVFFLQALSTIEAYEMQNSKDKDRLNILEAWAD